MSSSSTDDDFGSFVSVPPISVESISHPLSIGPLSPSPSPSSRDASTPRTTSSSNNNKPEPESASASMMFFDEFTRSARMNAESGKRKVLDELLGHQDDPLYWISASSSESSRDTETETGDPLTSSSPVPVRPPPHHVPTARSPTRTSPPTLAPPTLEYTTFSAPDPSIDMLSSSVDSLARHPGADGAGNTRPHSRAPSSHQTLSSLSSKFMSSLLHAQAPSSSLSHTSTPTAHTHTLPPPPPSASTPLGIPSPHPSPFAPHHAHTISIISGAPGFVPDEPYTGWDKDGTFYEDLERSSSPLQPIPPESTTAPDPTSRKKLTLYGPPLTLLGRNALTLNVLDTPLATTLRPHLPPLARLPPSWTLLYSLDQHGVSLKTLYQLCSKTGNGMVFVIRDAEDGRFGVWLGGGIMRVPSSTAFEEREGSGGEGYFGSGESFLWRESSPGVDIFKWTGANDYVALCHPTFLAFGGGDGTYGLYLDEALLDGTSEWCPTFDNPPLCTREGKEEGKKERKKGMMMRRFECVGLEVWGV